MYFAFVIDAYSRPIVGWQLADAHAHRPGPRRAADGARHAGARRRRRAGAPLRPRQSKADSTGRRNTLIERGCDGQVGSGGRRMRAGRPAMRSPGRPPVGAAEHRERFWAAIARGAVERGRGGGGGRVAGRLASGGSARVAGCRRSALAPLSGRYLSFAEREEIALLRAQRLRGAGDRAPARARRRRRSRGSCGATPRRAAAGSSTGRRPRSGMPSGARGGRSRRSSPRNERLREYVQDRLAGRGRRARRDAWCAGRSALDRPPPRPPRRTGAGRGRGARSRSPTGSALDFPDDESMRISHEAIYQSLYVQGRGALRARADRVPAHRPGAARAQSARTRRAARASSPTRS